MQAQTGSTAPQRAFDEVRDGLTRRSGEADRLLLAIMQMSLSLIGFGFTIFQIFSDAAVRTGLSWPSPLARFVGLALLALGILLLSGGLWGRIDTLRDHNVRRAWLMAQPDGPHLPPARPSSVLLVGGLLLSVAVGTLTVIVFRLAR